jgi:hypothetical protein
MGPQLSTWSHMPSCWKLAVVLSPLAMGCFSLQPVDRLAPKVGAEVAVDLNDAGRAALSPKLGPEVAQVHGNLLRRDGDEDVLAVTSTEFVHGGVRPWSGDTVHVRSDYTARYYENRVSTQRSLIAGGIIAATVAVLTARALTTTPVLQPDGGIQGPGDKLRAPLRGGLRFSTSSTAVDRAARLLIPFITRH